MKALLCPHSDPGYLYPALAIGQELRRAGADALLIGRRSACDAVTEARIPFVPESEVGTDSAFSVQRWFVRGEAQYNAVLRAAKTFRPDVVVTSVLHHGALLAAEVLDLPVVVIGMAAHLWSYAAPGRCSDEELWSRRWRARTDILADNRRRVGLPRRNEAALERSLRGSLLMLRGLPAFEVAGARLPAGVIHVGPCWWEPAADPARIADAMAGVPADAPFVYVHLGRVFGGESLWPLLTTAFQGTGLRAVVERGRCHEAEPAIDANVRIVRLPWMGPLIAQAELVITNATSAPVLGALLHGRPLLVAPCGSEQPVLAAACLRAGVARLWIREAPKLGAPAVREAIADPRLAEAVLKAGRELASDRAGAVAARAVLAVAGSVLDSAERATV